MSMTLILYNFTGDDTDVDKQASLTQVLSLSGELRSETDVCHPSFIIDAKGTDINGVNYAYVAAWNRYYYVRKRTVINPGGALTGQNGTFRIDLDVDVLFSYKTGILNEHAFISRCDYVDYIDKFVFDKEVPIRSSRGIRKHAFPNNPLATHVSTGTEPAYHYNYCVVTASDEHTTNDASSNVSSLPPIFVKNYKWLASNNSILTTYVTDYQNLVYMMNYLTSDDAFTQLSQYLFKASAEGIVSIVGYPFDLKNVDTLGCDSVMSHMHIGHTEIMYHYGQQGSQTQYADGYMVGRNYLAILDFGSLDLTAYERDYRDLEPVSDYYAFLPYVGIVKLNGADVLRRQISLSYILDITTGDATAFLYDDTGIIIGTYQCRLGWKVALTASNAQQLIAQKISGGMQLVMGTVMAGLSMSSGNAVGTLAGVKSIASGLQGGVLERTQYSGAMGEGRTNANVDPHAYIFVTRSETADPQNDIAPTIGLPCNQYLQLSTFTGHGYVRVGEIHPHHYSGATNEEMDQIISLLKSGVHF